MQFNDKNKIKIFGAIVAILMIIFLCIFLQKNRNFKQLKQDDIEYTDNTLSAEESDQKYSYFIRSVDSRKKGERETIGTYVFTKKINDENQIEIQEKESINAHINSEEFLDVVENQKTYLFDENFDLISLAEKEYLTEELQLSRSFELERSANGTAINEYIKDKLEKVTYLPNDKTKTSLASSGMFSLLIVNPSRVFPNEMYFTNSLESYIEQYSFLRTESISNDFLGDVECDVIKYSGVFENLLWIDKDGVLVKREKIYDENLKLVFELFYAK